MNDKTPAVIRASSPWCARSTSCSSWPRVGRRSVWASLRADRGLPTPTVHRLIQTLLPFGIVRHAEGRRYTLGPGLIALGDAARATLGSRAQPFLDELHDRVGETVDFAVLDRADVVYLAQATSRHMVRMFTEVGRRVVRYCTAVGKVLLAELPDARARACSHCRPCLATRPPRSPTPRNCSPTSRRCGSKAGPWMTESWRWESGASRSSSPASRR